jgi:hypothetical protein
MLNLHEGFRSSWRRLKEHNLATKDKTKKENRLTIMMYTNLPGEAKLRNLLTISRDQVDMSIELVYSKLQRYLLNPTQEIYQRSLAIMCKSKANCTSMQIHCSPQ